MARLPVLLDDIRIASPCQVPWSSMTKVGEHVRHCGSCDLDVFNLTSMTRADAEALIQARNGRLCVRYYRRFDGTILTEDCPLGVRLKERARRTLAIAAGLALTLLAGMGAALGATTCPRTGTGPMARLERWLGLSTAMPLAGAPMPIKGKIAMPISTPPGTTQGGVSPWQP